MGFKGFLNIALLLSVVGCSPSFRSAATGADSTSAASDTDPEATATPTPTATPSGGSGPSGSGSFGWSVATDDDHWELPISNSYVKHGDDIYFIAMNAALYKKVYRIRAGAVTQVSDAWPSHDDQPEQLVSSGDYFYFVANVGEVFMGPKIQKLFSIGPTDVLTQIDVNAAGVNDDPAEVVSLGDGKVYFSANNGTGSDRKLYTTDGTTAFQASNTNSGGDDNPLNLTVLGSFVHYTSIRNACNCRGLYKNRYWTNGFNVDGSAHVLVSSDNPALSDFNYISTDRSRIYFTQLVFDGAGWVSRWHTLEAELPVRIGSYEVSNTYYPMAIYGNFPILVGNNSYYIAMNGTGTELYKYNGTAETFSVIDAGDGAAAAHSSLTKIDDQLFYLHTTAGGWQIKKIDTANGDAITTDGTVLESPTLHKVGNKIFVTTINNRV